MSPPDRPPRPHRRAELNGDVELYLRLNEWEHGESAQMRAFARAMKAVYPGFVAWGQAETQPPEAMMGWCLLIANLSGILLDQWGRDPAARAEAAERIVARFAESLRARYAAEPAGAPDAPNPGA